MLTDEGIMISLEEFNYEMGGGQRDASLSHKSIEPRRLLGPLVWRGRLKQLTSSVAAMSRAAARCWWVQDLSLWVSRFLSYTHTVSVRDWCIHLSQLLQVTIHSIPVPLVLTDNVPTTFWL